VPNQKQEIPMKIALLIEFKDGEIKPASYGLLAAAGGGGNETLALICRPDAEDFCEALAAYGADRVVGLPQGETAAAQADLVVQALRALGAEVLMGLSTPSGRDLLPRVAARLDAPLVMNCVAVKPRERRAKAYQFSGKTLATLRLKGTHQIYGIRPNVIEALPRPAEGRFSRLDLVAGEAVSAATKLVETRSGTAGGVDLSEADVIFSGGRGLKNGENFKLLHDCAAPLNAAVGASRVAVDNGWVPYAMQVGQTGVKVNPKVYLAWGISGSIQHYAGMKTSGLIIAINTDAEAPIMANCDYYVVGDLFEILPAFSKALKRALA
jgi:electron transfer flavoprotein alpha subunit